MPVAPGDPSSLPRQPGIGPDVGNAPTPAWAVTIAMETPVAIPSDFDTLPPEQQKEIEDQYRFSGIRLRSDMKEQTIKVSGETLDIP